MYSLVFAVLAGLAACADKTAAEAQSSYQAAHQKYLESMKKTNSLMESLKSKVSSLRGRTAEFKKDEMAKVALIEGEHVSDKAKLEQIVSEAETKIAAIMARSSSFLETRTQTPEPQTLINTDHLKEVKQKLVSALDKLKAFQMPSAAAPSSVSFLEVAAHKQPVKPNHAMDERLANLQSRVFSLGQQLDAQISSADAALKSMKSAEP